MSTENVAPLPQRRPAYIPEWTFADRLRKARLTTGMGGREFALRIGCNYSAYAQWEAGNSKPRDLIETAKQIEAVTGVAAIWLVGMNPQDNDSGMKPAGWWFESTSGSQDAKNGVVIPFPVRVTDAIERDELATVHQLRSAS